MLLQQLIKLLSEEARREKYEQQQNLAVLEELNQYKRNAGMVDAVMQMPDLIRHGKK